MRVIAGSLGGRQFDSPSGHRTHPMSEKIRGALFNILGDISGLRVLDAFCGSGALAIESISRGAESAVAVDVDKSAHSTTTRNIANLGLGRQVQVVRANIAGWSEHNSDELFDLILADPPYDHVRASQLAACARHCRRGGVMVMSLPPSYEPDLEGLGLVLAADKNYGDARLLVATKP